jgi:hypothetical protein
MDAHQLVREIAQETGADERSVTKRLAGVPVRGGLGRAIDAALERRGLEPRSDFRSSTERVVR